MQILTILLTLITSNSASDAARDPDSDALKTLTGAMGLEGGVCEFKPTGPASCSLTCGGASASCTNKSDGGGLYTSCTITAPGSEPSRLELDGHIC